MEILKNQEEYNSWVERIVVTVTSDAEMHQLTSNAIESEVSSNLKPSLTGTRFLWVLLRPAYKIEGIGFAKRGQEHLGVVPEDVWRELAIYFKEEITENIYNRNKGYLSVDEIERRFNKLLGRVPNKNPCSEVVLGHSSLIEEAQEGIEKANEIFANVEQKLNQAKAETILENKMSELQNQAFKTVDFVYGQDLSKMTAEQLLNGIRRAKADISSYSMVDVKSKHIETKVAELNAAIEKMVAQLDTL